MADDPNRDILPVREGSCLDTCRSNIDPRERHIVYKLDRYDLEDKYLRLLEEASSLKKLSNCQEDKIKRLATKLMRVTANPRTCPAALDIFDEKNKIIALELENAKLKDKISVLRNQLLSHTIAGRSSSRSRNPQARPSSGRITCRSESSRTKIPSCHCIVEMENDDSRSQKNFNKIEELEAEKKEMSSRITQLEKELSASSVSNQREKVAENVEYIRVWRQMKQLNDKLIAAQSTNESLNVQINDLKRKLEETTKNNQEITMALLEEKKRLLEMDEQMLKAKDSQLSLREKDEQIKDLMNEMKILQQHNNELIALSNKSGEVELENIELKKKVHEHRNDQENLKTAYNNDQANVVALQASNEQLLGKLQELQKNIDSLTVQLTSFQTQTDKQEASTGTQISTKQIDKKPSIAVDRRESYEESSTQVDKCNKCCEALEKLLSLEKIMHVARETKSTDKFVQTEYTIHAASSNTKDQGTSAMTPVKEKPQKEETRTVDRFVDCTAMAGSPLTPEKMLRLLEQAQFDMPPETGRFVSRDAAINVDYNDIMDLNQRHSDTETSATQAFQQKFQQRTSDKDTNTFLAADCQLTDSTKILSMLYNILQEYSFLCTSRDGSPNLYRPPSSDRRQFAKGVNNNVDANNNSEPKKNLSFKDQQTENCPFEIYDSSKIIETPLTNGARNGCHARKSCSGIYSRLRQDRSKRKMFSGVRKRGRVIKFAESEDCTCNDSMRCRDSSNCGQCCNGGSNEAKVQYEIDPMMAENSLQNVNSPVQGHVLNTAIQNYSQNGVNTIYKTRNNLQGGNDMGQYRPWEDNQFPNERNEDFEDEMKINEYMNRLDKCRELLDSNCPLNVASGIPVKEIMEHANITDSIQYHGSIVNTGAKTETRKTESFCNMKCPNDCTDTSSSVSDSFPIVIADGEGLMELHILSLQLSTSAKQILFQESDICNVSLFISWELWNQETAYTPTMKGPKLNFNSSFVYRIPDLFSFFNYVLLEFVIFEVNVFHENSDGYTVARGKLCIKDILDYPQNKLHYIAPVNSVLPCSVAMNFGQLSLWVRLSCDVDKVDAFKKQRGLHSIPEYRQDTMESLPRLPTVPKVVEEPLENDLLVLKDRSSREHLTFEQSKEQIPFMPHQSGYESQSSGASYDAVNSRTTHSASPDQFSSSISRVSKLPPKSEQTVSAASTDNTSRTTNISKVQDSFPVQTSPQDVFMRDFKDSPNREPIVDSGKKEMEMAEDSSSIIEFNALITNSNADDRIKRDSTKSLYEVTDVISERNWEKYRRRSLLTFSSLHRPTGMDAMQNNETDTTIDALPEKDTIIIEIVNIILFPKSTVMQNDDIRLIYVEYCFLGHCGADMETASVAKPKPPNQKLTYNFRRKFHVDEPEHSVHDNILRSMLNDSTTSSIIFIVVSEPLPEETQTKECVEIGSAHFNVRQYALGDGEKIVSLPIYSPGGSEQIGLLKIFVLGLDTIRQRLGRRESSF